MENIKNLAETTLTAHELANILLQFPDYPVKVVGSGRKIHSVGIWELLSSPDESEELGEQIILTLNPDEGEDEDWENDEDDIDDEDEDEDEDWEDDDDE